MYKRQRELLLNVYKEIVSIMNNETPRLKFLPQIYLYKIIKEKSFDRFLQNRNVFLKPNVYKLSLIHIYSPTPKRERKNTKLYIIPVSYTHLDVYKRQIYEVTILRGGKNKNF